MRRVWTAADHGRWRPGISASALLVALALTAAACGGTSTSSNVDEAGASSLPLADGTDDTENATSGDGDNKDSQEHNTDNNIDGGDDEGDLDAGAGLATTDHPEPETSSGAGCLATSAADGINVVWWGMPVADAGESDERAGLDVLGDGEILMQVGAQVEGVVTLFGAPAEPGLAVTLKARSADSATTFECGTAGTLLNLPVPNCTIELVGGKPQLVVSYDDGSAGPLGRTVIRDGERINTNLAGGPNPIDTSADPGAEYQYQIEMSDSSDRPPVVADCGSVTVPELGDDSTELLAAKELFNRTALGPHAYFIVSAGGENQDFYMQALGPDGHAFVPPLDDPTLRNPFTIHDELILAIDAGQDVAYELDESSGLPTWWTVDGATTKFICFEVDTAPPELRVGPCDPQTDLIAR